MKDQKLPSMIGNAYRSLDLDTKSFETGSYRKANPI